MCVNLADIKCKEKGGGRFIYDMSSHEFVGEQTKVTESSYYYYDKERY